MVEDKAFRKIKLILDISLFICYTIKMMGKQKVRIDLVGQPFGSLTVLEFAGTDKWGNALWKCVCSRDGNTTIVIGNSLRRGLTKSCGCGATQKGSDNPRYKHGQAGVKVRTPEYNTWISINRRCTDIKSKDYRDYGGRGIKVCARWKNSFENFFADMGVRPSKTHSLDRKENNGN